MPYRDFHYRWEYELRSSPERFWSFVADTNRFNRDAGVPALQPAAGKGQRLRNARRHLRLSFLGMPVEWEEQPFEWIKPSRFGVVRKYSKGPIAQLKVLAELSPRGDGGTKLVYQIWVTPKSLLGFLLTPLQFGYASQRKFASAFESYDKTARAEIPMSSQQSIPELSAGNRGRLEALKEKLVVHGAVPQVVEKLIDFIERADDFSLARIRPYTLADQWNESRRAVLTACLLGTRLGLLDMRWDLLCPLCRGPQASETSLSDISSKVHCETCRIDFTVNFDRFVEITFKPNASVRRAEVKDYCMGSPQRTPHVVVQQLLAPHSSRNLVLPLEEGSYRLRTLELPGERLVTVSTEGAETATARISDRVSGEELKLAPRTTLQVDNASDAEQLFILERLQWGDQAATAAEVTALQIFRDLFSSEALRPGEQISVGTLTVLFTDLRHSTQLYREIGDATAFGRVLNHFDVLKKAIAEADGALVKTIGDAVMGVFRDSASALNAVLTAQQNLAAPPEGTAPLTLKAGMHTGPCIAVTLNDRLDYFGSTVNMAARLEGLSTGNDVIISRSVYDDPEVRELINSADTNLQAVPFEILLKGFDEERFELWRVGRKKTDMPEG
ncbi:MAG: adenylate/guanylate cyclase domain-containing protein, partial [Acidobacteriota bacterium]|nr:adenylate/guanylate cyclase domain-containing protein [Acidobacteriota bacterium]